MHQNSRSTLCVALATSLLSAACAAHNPAAPAGATFANPLDLDYRFAREGVSHRTAADPLITLYGDEYYLFASRSGGYWRSHDLRDWTLVVPDGLPLEEYAPAVVAIGGRLYYTAHKLKAVYATDDPGSGRWERVAELGEYADPAFLLDDDGRLYLYYGSALNGVISAVELDPRSFAVVGGPYVLFQANIAEHGWERSGPDNLGAQMTEGFRIGAWVEGSWMTKHNGTYYLQYSAPGTVWKTYADGVYTSSSPTSGFTYQPYSPFAYRAGGFIGSAGHGAMFRDRDGRYWRVVTMVISVAHKFERRLGIFPAGFDDDGVIRTDTYLGDYPQYLPGVVDRPLDANRTGWMLLSYRKPVTASSTLAGHEPTLAVDEDIRTWWSATSAAAGEWLQLDLGMQSSIHALQVNFAEQGTTAVGDLLGRRPGMHQQYLLEGSLDGRSWFNLVDRRANQRDVPHDYIQLPRAERARYVRITNGHAAAGGLFSVRDLRVFGFGDTALPREVQSLTVARDANDPRTVTLGWPASTGARDYVVRFGVQPDRLYGNYQVGDSTSLTLNSLNVGVRYYFTVDALNERGIAPGRLVWRDDGQPSGQ